MNLDLIYPALPPAMDGIGDYTATLARQLSRSIRVRILTCRGSYSPVEGVEINPCFKVSPPCEVWAIRKQLVESPPDWILLQYNPFSYGKRGWNPFLPFALARARGKLPSTRLAVMVHEPFMSASNFKFAVMTSYQRLQLWMLGHTADLIFFSIHHWVCRFRRWFPSKPLQHLPVGSNIPDVGLNRAQARADLRISEKTLVLGLFGTARHPRMLEWIASAAQSARHHGFDPLLLYIGPDEEVIKNTIWGVSIQAQGVLGGEAVSRCLSAVDIYLAPFIDGASTRRTSLMTGLQHALPVISTRGDLTDPVLEDLDGQALSLADAGSFADFEARVLALARDPHTRLAMGRSGRALYNREFTWDRVASRLLECFTAFGPSAHANL